VPPPRVVVLGDLTLDVVLAPEVPLVASSDVPGRVLLRQGGSAANTARWLARSGLRTTLVTAVGRDAAGRALVLALEDEHVLVRALRVGGARTGRIGVLVEPGGERSFVADRGAADALRADDLREAWFGGCDLLHLPGYSLIGERPGLAGRRSAALAHARGALVTVDLASVVPLLAGGRRRAAETIRSAAPDLLFATVGEARALAAPGRGRPEEDLLDLAPRAVVKRGPGGASVLLRDGSRVLRFEIATRPLAATDTTGAGDAFDAGFIAAWLAARADGRAEAPALRRAALAGHRLAARHLTARRPELRLA
jgi:sugar/nucleoside kinase (ribokinase family)